MRVRIVCCMWMLFMAAVQPLGLAAQQTGAKSQNSAQAAPNSPGTTALSDEEKANQLSEQVGKLMVQCVNLLTAQDPLSLETCKEQRDLAEQYPPRQRMVDKMLAHDEYGIALAAFDHKQEALGEFNQEIVLLPKTVKLGTTEWGTAYWHRAMIYYQLGENGPADRDYRAAEESFRKQQREQRAEHPDKKMKAILRQHASLLEKEGKTEASQKLLAEAAK